MNAQSIVESKPTLEGRAPSSEYLMINQVRIRNFKCFKNFEQSGLRRFTFIVGDSGSGKTALLEALFLAGGSNPEIYFRVRRWRGLGSSKIQLSGTRESYEALFRDMFHNFDQSADIDIRFTDSRTQSRSLQIFYEGQEVYTLPLEEKEIGNPFLVEPIVFKWETPNKVMRSDIKVEDGTMKMTGGPDVYPLILVSNRTFNAAQDAERFSALSRRKRADPIVEAVRTIFPEVIDVTLEQLGGEAMIFVSLEGLPEKLPLVDLSGGITKYLTLVLAILTNPGGAVLVDEIENGFYYANLTKMLGSLFRLCERHEVQLIASTHSYEFLQSLLPLMDSVARKEKDFTLLRFERVKGQPEAHLIEGQSYRAAIEHQFEIR